VAQWGLKTMEENIIKSLLINMKDEPAFEYGYLYTKDYDAEVLSNLLMFAIKN
jgi:hypothetical protein